MPLRDPFAAYNASSNLEAHMVCGLLQDAGIEAMAIEDNSQAGLWVGGTLAEIHKPQVWIERSDIERASAILTDYDRRSTERLSGKQGLAVDVVCEKCGKQSTFPAVQSGTVQNCPHCRAYIDVGDDEDREEREA